MWWEWILSGLVLINGNLHLAGQVSNNVPYFGTWDIATDTTSDKCISAQTAQPLTLNNGYSRKQAFVKKQGLSATLLPKEYPLTFARLKNPGAKKG